MFLSCSDSKPKDLSKLYEEGDLVKAYVTKVQIQFESCWQERRFISTTD